MLLEYCRLRAGYEVPHPAKGAHKSDFMLNHCLAAKHVFKDKAGSNLKTWFCMSVGALITDLNAMGSNSR